MDVDNMQAVIDAARKGVELTVLDQSTHHKIVYTPEHGVETISLEKHNARPARKTGTVTVLDAPSFNDLLTANAFPGATTIYIDPKTDDPAIIAVINGNGLAGPGFGDFRIKIGFRPTPQWVKWKQIDGKLMPQATFAEFVEDNLADIASPPGGEMMEIVTYLQATRSVDFKSGIRLSNGQVQFQNLESIDAKVGAGETQVPEMFTVALSPVVGVQPFTIPARFRYRIEGGKLHLGFKLARIEDVVAQVVKEIQDAIVPPEGVAMVYGIAPAPAAS
jgi:uncharacterized protein YfdQ (DUF2303 family)